MTFRTHELKIIIQQLLLEDVLIVKIQGGIRRKSETEKPTSSKEDWYNEEQREEKRNREETEDKTLIYCKKKCIGVHIVFDRAKKEPQLSNHWVAHCLLTVECCSHFQRWVVPSTVLS